MEGEDIRSGTKKKRSKKEIGFDSDDDEPIGSIFKLKRSRKKASCSDAVREKEDLGGMDDNDTLASFRKRLKGPKRDQGSGATRGASPALHVPIEVEGGAVAVSDEDLAALGPKGKDEKGDDMQMQDSSDQHMEDSLSAIFHKAPSNSSRKSRTPRLNIITEYVFGLIYPGRPIANVCFKTYGYISMAQAFSFLGDFKLGHYMKIPPRSMFLVQFIGTMLAGTINIGVAWWLLNSIKNICNDNLLPKRIFGSQGNYSAMNWFFLGGALGPIIVWLLHKAFPKQSWIPLINLPVLLEAIGMMPPATPLKYNAWIFFGTIFNFFIFRYRKKWWQRYNYVLSAALDSGVTFMTVLLYFSLGLENKSLTWWGTDGEPVPSQLAQTAKGVIVSAVLSDDRKYLILLNNKLFVDS
ncbi:Oligopeptide transporter 4, partial [Mucuna pruriens]